LIVRKQHQHEAQNNPKRCRAPLATVLQNSRRDFLKAASVSAVAIHLPLPKATAPNEVNILSPNRAIALSIFSDANSNLTYRVSLRDQLVIETSPLGITIDGVNLSQSVVFGKNVPYRLNERYPVRGGKAEAVNSCNGTSLEITHLPSHTTYAVQARAFNDGVAFRFLVFGEGERVPDEATVFRIPSRSTVWFHDFEGHYEGIHQEKDIAAVKDGDWAAPPLTVRLPNGAGYAAITEAALMNYAGMGLEGDGQRGFRAVLGHALPVSHPFDLRYGKDEAKRLSQPASIKGLITTPWRVVMIGAELNALVNSDVISNLALRSDRRLFPADLKTDWLRPGRAVWRYLDGGDNTFDGVKEFSRLAGELGFEHNVVEGLWHRWTEDQMQELVDYSKQRNVGIWFWEHSKNLRTPDAREKFFAQLQRLGVVGAKIDFFDHEAKEIIDLYQALLRSSAEHKIMVEFHGANKPAGESRTWPNEMTREAIRGLEYRSMEKRARHNTTLPFTRFLAGHADYTPVHFGERRKETSWAHQIATAIVFTSPLMIYGAHPKSILENPAVELIKSIPSVWDETVVQPFSEIGEIAGFARRRGETWFVGILNGDVEKSVSLKLSFLGPGSHHAMLVGDQKDDPAAIKIESASVDRAESLRIEMRAGGGFVGRFRR
jgi:alpha-glucosidase